MFFDGASRIGYLLSEQDSDSGESRYNPIKKECLALVFAIQRARHYLVGQTIHVISKVNPLRLLMTKPGSLNLRPAKWALLLSQYDMLFVSQKAVKARRLQISWLLIWFQKA